MSFFSIHTIRYILPLWPLLAICLTNLSAQSFFASTKQFGIEDGLSHNQILSTYKDSRGMMWMLAKDQLNRFDGRDCKAISATELKYTSFGQILFEDEVGDLWIRQSFYPSKLLFFNIYSETVRTTAEKFAGTPLANWIDFYGVSQTSNGLVVADEKGALFTFQDEQLKPAGKLPKGLSYWPLESTKGDKQWWAVFSEDLSHQLCLVDEDGSLVLSKNIGLAKLPQKPLPDNRVVFIENNQLHYLSPGGEMSSIQLPLVAQISKESRFDFIHYQIAYDDVHDWIWLQGKNHLLVLDLEGNLVYDFLPENPFLRIANSYQLYLDTTGELWLSSIEGCYLLRLQKKKFERHLWQDSELVSSTDLISCRGISANKEGAIYVSGKARLFHLENETTQVLDSLIAYNYTALHIDDTGDVWAAGPKMILQVAPDNSIQRWPIGDGSARCIYQEGSKLWLGLEDSKGNWLASFDINTKQFVQATLPEGQQIPTGLVIHHIYPAKDDQLWLLSNHGLFLYQEQGGVIARYWTGGTEAFYLPQNNLKYMYRDQQGIYWLATSKGLLKWDKEQHTVRQYTTEDGLSHNNLYAVYEDDFGCLWISSDYGIIQFQKATAQVRTYLMDAGITHNEFNWSSHFQDTEGQLYFGGLNGLTSFHPRDFQDTFDEILDKPLILTECQVVSDAYGEERDLRQNFKELNSITIHPNDRLLSLQFALLEYANNAQVQYAYRIEGFVEDWQYVKDHSLLLSGLPYGDFVLHIKGRSGNGSYSQQQLHIPIKVLKPFYLQMWFIGLVSLLLLGALWYYMRWYTRRLALNNRVLEKKVAERTLLITKQAEELKALNQSKTRFFANVAHELRTPLTLIQGPLQSVLKKTKLPSQAKALLNKAKGNAKDLLQLVDEILDHVKLESATLKTVETPVNLYPLIRQLAVQFESLEHNSHQVFSLHYELPEVLYISIDEGKLQKIINNLLLNAFKFTPAGRKVQLIVKEEQDKLLIEVRDEGRGIPEKDLPYIFERFFQSQSREEPEGGTGIGLALVKEYTKVMGGTISVESILSEGTVFKVLLPLKQLGYRSESFPEELQTVDTDKDVPVFPVRDAPKDAPLILIVEDHHDLRDYLRILLQDYYRIEMADHGLAALDYLSESLKNDDVPALIISDLMMPIMDGYELVKALKFREYLRHIPMIMLTAKADKDARLRALRIGIDDYIIKPFDEEELLVRIANVLAMRKKILLSPVPADVKELPAVIEPVNDTESLPHDWLLELEEITLSNISDSDFTLEQLALQLHISRSSLYRKLKERTGLSGNQYLREIRLQEARKLLEQRSHKSIKSVALAVGFSKANYFSKLFEERFGKKPISYFSNH